MDAQTSSTSKSPNPFLGYLFDIVAPFAAYFIVGKFGAPAFWGLALGGVIAGTSTAINSIKRKKLDTIGILVIVELFASIIFLLVLRDPRLLLIRPSFYTGIASIYLAATAFAGRPLSYDGAKPMAAKDGPERLAAYERAWAESAEFRQTHNFVTWGFALALLVDSILRIVVVYKFPLNRAMWVSNIPHVAAIILIIASSALAGRRFSRIVDQFQRT
jgi:hypothetical protein